MDSPSPSISAYFEQGDDEGPTQEPLPLCPPILKDYPDLQHAWKVVNWVYATREEKSGIPSTPCHLSSNYLLILSCIDSKAARKKIVKTTAGLLMLGLYILWNTATTKYESEPSLQASGPSGLNPLHSERNQWGHVAYQVHRRQDWVFIYTGHRLIPKADYLMLRSSNTSQPLLLPLRTTFRLQCCP